jgi:bifunctional DNA-binding transcriptional regulator/antitoxin component of YhaV-PrlF toxin-antitoxin module
MPRLIVDSDGRLSIPPEIIKKRGLQPGDELALVESADGMLVYEGGVDRKTLEWWAGLSEEKRPDAAAEARRYEALSEEERESLWSESVESPDGGREEDELDPTANPTISSLPTIRKNRIRLKAGSRP